MAVEQNRAKIRSISTLKATRNGKNFTEKKQSNPLQKYYGPNIALQDKFFADQEVIPFTPKPEARFGQVKLFGSNNKKNLLLDKARLNYMSSNNSKEKLMADTKVPLTPKTP